MDPKNYQRAYIKTKRANADLPGEHIFHIHVDAQEILPDTITEMLLAAGLTYDLFDADWNFYGKDGDKDKAFEHHAPAQHMTFVTSNAAMFEEKWQETVAIVKKCQAKCYIEGELIVLDSPLIAKPFNELTFKKIAPVINPTENQFIYRSAIDGLDHSLPALIKLRRLDPFKNGPKDRFRCGEMHMTVRDDTDPRLLELFCNLGFSVPAIPKLVESYDGTLDRNFDGSFFTIRDIPLTLQATDMNLLMRVANLAVTLVEEIGGVQNGSVKIEFAIRFAVLNGVDYNNSVPPVLDSAVFRHDFENLSSNHLGSMEVDLIDLTRQTRERAKSTPHVNKLEEFRLIWDRSGL